MCNLYSLTRTPEELRRIFAIFSDTSGNWPSLPAIFPDQTAPVVRVDDSGRRELTTMLWGFPPPPQVGTRPVTNVRNVKSPYWRAWLKPGYRCLVPVTSFCEYTDSQPKIPHWFALDESRPVFAFAGLWRPWTGERRKVQGEHRLFAFLTSEANGVVGPVHSKAMPVMLTEPDWETWLNAPADEALRLQRPFPEEDMRVVATGQRKDEAA